VTINGARFWTIGLNQTTEGGVQHVEQYVAMQGSVLLQFMLVSPDEKGLKDLESSIQSIQLKHMATKPTSRSKSSTQKAN
jgi:hypothetical protein